MKISILGTGMVGQTIATRLVGLGYEVSMETRNVEQTKARTKASPMTGKSFASWYEENASVHLVQYGDSVMAADLIINATSGSGSLPALKLIGEEKLAGKVLLDISNPLDFSQGMPPSLFVSNTDSLAEQIQATYPKTHVVKSLNTMTASLMVNPASLEGNHNVFVSGNNEEAKHSVSSFLTSMGWKPDNIIDLGDITTARGTEMMLPIWLRLWGALGHANFNFHIQK